MLDRPGWDEYFVMVARTVGVRGDCRRRRIGAVVVDVDHRIVSTGYNGVRPGAPGCLGGHCPRGLLSYDVLGLGESYKGNCIATHAERNALTYFWKAQESGLRILASSCTLYVSDVPCEWCRTLILGSGFRRIVYPLDPGIQVEEYFEGISENR